jgi:hypothetical protein
MMPVTTGVFGRYGDVEIAVVLYAVNVIAASALDTAMLWVALRRGLLAADAGSPRAMLLLNAFPGLVFLCSVPVALVAPSVAPWLWIALALGPSFLRPRLQRTPIA